MAKGRKLTTSRSERYLGGSYGYSNGQSASVTDEFREEDVWSTVDDAADRDNDQSISNGSQGRWSSRDSENGGLRPCRRIPKGNSSRHVGGLSLAFEDSEKTATSRIVHQYRNQDSVASPRAGRHMATSAPVNVPDWHNILRVDSVDSLHDSDDDRDSEWVPPHEYLAREYARSRKMAATSVFEGVGRTLKGRDMSRVRDAVWSQTGFDG
ncbi:Senescence regulator S40 [Dillenia turbinata]|uniref:Senescence regulator S40 n=1 Tax=Dillenia turbinata TaxID=194707 RepID=A0AAN8UQS0_9MAGN